MKTITHCRWATIELLTPAKYSCHLLWFSFALDMLLGVMVHFPSAHLEANSGEGEGDAPILVSSPSNQTIFLTFSTFYNIPLKVRLATYILCSSQVAVVVVLIVIFILC